MGNTQFKGDFNHYKRTIKNNFPEVTRLKTELNEIYTDNIPHEAQFAEPFQHWRFNILVNNKDELLKTIFSEGLFASSHYASLTSMFKRPSCTNAQRLYDKVVNLFNDFRYNVEQALITSRLVKEHIYRYGSGKL